MYNCLLKYKEIDSAHIGADVVVFSANELVSPEIIIKNIFVTNNQNTEQTFSCFILKTTDNTKFNLVAENERISENSTYSVINKPIYLESDARLVFNGSQTDMNMSLCITYDVGV